MSRVNTTGNAGVTSFIIEAGVMECSICISPLAADDIYYTPCSHVFDSRCIETFLKNSNECPVCRQRISPAHVRRLDVNIDFPKLGCKNTILSYKRHIDELEAAIMEQKNLILNYQAELQKENSNIDKMMAILQKHDAGLHCSSCHSPQVTSFRARSNMDAVPCIESPVKKIEKLIKDIKRESKDSINIERQKRREDSQKLKEERALALKLKKELRTVKAECKVCQRKIKELEKAADLPSKYDDRTTFRTVKPKSEKKIML